MSSELPVKLERLATAIKVRNELEAKAMKANVDREIREYRFRVLLALGVLLLAGVRVIELAGLVGG